MTKRIPACSIFSMCTIGVVIMCLCSCVEKNLEPIGGRNLLDTTGSDSTSVSSPSTDTIDTNIISTDSNSDTDSDSDSVSDSALDTVTDSEFPDTASDTETSDTESDTSPPKKWVGCATQNETYPADFFDRWNQVTPENAGKWGVIESERDVMVWDTMDALYKEAKEKKIKFKGHTLIWHQQQPEWLKTLDESEQAVEIEQWIHAFCDRYNDMEMVNVVTAPVHDEPFYMNALGGKGVTGYDWVIKAFQLAREYCPNTRLLLEEYNVLIWETHIVRDVVNALKAESLIDGIGCAAHGLEGMDTNDLLANLNYVDANFDLPIYIAGYDINLKDDNAQLREMQTKFPIFYNYKSIVGITFWGYVEGRTWKPDAFLRYADGKPRPALNWLTAYLATFQ